MSDVTSLLILITICGTFVIGFIVLTKKTHKTTVYTNTLDRLHANCSNCEMEGYIDIPDLNSNYLLKCTQCNQFDSYVVCKNCETGGAYVDSLPDYPDYWICPYCGKKRELQTDFYKNIIPIISDRV